MVLAVEDLVFDLGGSSRCDVGMLERNVLKVLVPREYGARNCSFEEYKKSGA